MVAKPKPDQPQQAAVYVRVSTTGQEESGSSLETQEAAALAYAAEHGYAVTTVIRDVASGFTRDRPGLDRLRAMVRGRTITAVIAHALDRLSRNQVDTAIVLDELDRHGVTLALVTETIEQTAVGRFMLNARAFAAELEREKIRERTVRGRRARIDSGKLPGYAYVPYGYLRTEDARTLAVDPVTAPVVQRIFAEAAAGRPQRDIIADLDRDGIPTPRQSRQWARSTLQGILSNVVYLGEVQVYRWHFERQNGHRISHQRPLDERVILPAGTVPPLVDRALWDTVKERQAYNRTLARRKPHDPESHLLRGGHLVCGYCGSPMMTAFFHGKPVYRCWRAVNGRNECSYRGSIAGSVVDTDTWQRIDDALRNPQRVAEQAAKLAGESDPAEHDLAAINRALADIGRQQQNLVNSLALVDGAAATMIADKINMLDRQRQRLEEERAAVQAAASARRLVLRDLHDLGNACERIRSKLSSATYERKRWVLAILRVKVKVYSRDHTPRIDPSAIIPLDSLPLDATLLDGSSQWFVQQRSVEIPLLAGD